MEQPNFLFDMPDLVLDVAKLQTPKYSYCEVPQPELYTHDPLYTIDVKLFRLLASYGASWRELEYYFGVQADTLKKHFEPVYEQSQAQMRLSLKQKMTALALNGHPTMLIWLSKNLLGWTDKTNVVTKDSTSDEFTSTGSSFDGFEIKEYK